MSRIWTADLQYVVGARYRPWRVLVKCAKQHSNAVLKQRCVCDRTLNITLESSHQGLSANMLFISVQFLKAESCDIDARKWHMKSVYGWQ
jgi:hypothetical protein